MKESLLIVELNEFNIDLLKKGVAKLKLKNIERILKFNHSKTLSEDNIERHGLDPWVQWVSVHTGQKSSNHRIIRIGDIKKLKFPQIWEILGDKGFTTGIWGPMNASKKKTKGLQFFLPDPWTYSENAFPSSLNLFLSLPRYYSKNYIVPSKINLLKGVFKMIIFLISKGIIFNNFKESLSVFLIILNNGIKNMTLFSIFDIYSTIAFLKFKKDTKPDFSILFLNSLAHLQHHYWHQDLNKEIKMSLKVIDKIFGRILKEKGKNESIVIINALSQRNIFKKGVFIYRQIDTNKLFEALKINYDKFEEGMTNDIHIFFNSDKDKINAFNTLSNVYLNGEKLFFLEKDVNFKNELFYQLNYFKDVKSNDYFQIKDKFFKFFEYFTLLRERTGEHIHEGDILSEKVYFPKKLFNYQISSYILENFSKED
tara:strand:- start:259 stop:1536 length:1278 start_codon:yes stop_codon:yes gene_type:complete